METYDARKTHATLTFVDSSGAPRANCPVRLEQVRHAFEFGSAGAGMENENKTVQDLFLGLFETVTMPVFYWGRYEPKRGHTVKDEVLTSANWFKDHGIKIKGHPLVWHYVKPSWHDQLPLDEAERLLWERVQRETADFAGLIDTWDALNEPVIMPRFVNEPDGVPNAVTRIAQLRGRVEMIRLAVEAARKGNPNSFLVLNDFDLGPEYEHLIEEVLEAGIEINAIGLQSHMHQGFRGEDNLNEICERFARFGLPLHFTETTLVSGDLMPPEIKDLNDFQVDSWPSTPEGEQRQADDIVRHYKTLFAQPAVQSITYWGMHDNGTWLGAPAGIVNKDDSPKPAYDALKDLIKGEWWTKPTEVQTDAAGQVDFTGFAGDYRIRIGDTDEEILLPEGTCAVTVAAAASA